MGLRSGWETVRRAAGAAGACALVLLAACGGGGGDDGGDATPASPSGAVTLESSRTVRTTLGAAGGSLSATAADGRRYTLTVPPGALTASTEITATPVASMGDAPLAAGTRAAVRFGPAGLRFAMPARLRIEGAATTAGAGKRLVGFVRDDAGTAMNLQPPALAGAALELQVPHFSDVGVSEATPQEIALVPIVTPASVADEIFETAARELPPLSSGLQAVADVFAAIHDRIVSRELDDATRAGTPEARLVAATAFGIWDRAIELAMADPAQYAAVVALLGDRYVLSRARAGAFVKQDVDAGLAACATPAPIGSVQQDGLKSALSLQVFAGQRGLDDADLGLDAATVARRANACARVAFVPQAAPVFEVGRQVSLDAQAELIFAVDANFRAAQPFAFTVGSSAAAIATPEGVGDAAGRYTTVVTPSAADPLFDIKACLMVVVPQPVAFMPEGLLSPSAMCGTQQLGGELTEVVLAGLLTRNAAGLGISGSVNLRARFSRSGTVTVVSVDGSATSRGSGEVACGGPQQQVVLSVSRENVLNQGRFVSASNSFKLFGPQTTRADRLVSPGDSCATTVEVTTVEDGDLLGSADITAITRDAAGLPLSITIGSGGTTLSGTMVRQ
jgi:hypothetical protein